MIEVSWVCLCRRACSANHRTGTHSVLSAISKVNTCFSEKKRTIDTLAVWALYRGNRKAIQKEQPQPSLNAWLFTYVSWIITAQSTTSLQAAGLLTLAAFAKWMLAHPLGSLPAGIKNKNVRFPNLHIRQHTSKKLYLYRITLNTAQCNDMLEPGSVMQSGFTASELVKQDRWSS